MIIDVITEWSIHHELILSTSALCCCRLCSVWKGSFLWIVQHQPAAAESCWRISAFHVLLFPTRPRATLHMATLFLTSWRSGHPMIDITKAFSFHCLIFSLISPFRETLRVNFCYVVWIGWFALRLFNVFINYKPDYRRWWRVERQWVDPFFIRKKPRLRAGSNTLPIKSLKPASMGKRRNRNAFRCA